MILTPTQVGLGTKRGTVTFATDTGKQFVVSMGVAEAKEYIDLLDQPQEVTLTPKPTTPKEQTK